MPHRLRALVALALAILPAEAVAADYFVAPNGDNANPGTEAEPWRDIAFATCGGTPECPVATDNPNRLQAGDTLYLRGGEYREHDIRIANAGTPDAPITLIAYEGETPEINGDVDGERDVIFRLGSQYDADYVTFDGLVVHGGRQAGWNIGENRDVTGTLIQNCECYDIEIADNTACVFLEPTHGTTVVRHNVLHLGHVETGRGAGVELFRGSNDAVIEHNEIYDSHKGIYFKHGVNDPDVGPTVRANYVHDVGYTGIDIQTDRARVEHNVVVGAPIAVFGDISAGCDLQGGFHSRIAHNTVIGAAIELHSSIGECEGQTPPPTRSSRYSDVLDNLVVSPGRAYLLWTDPADEVGHASDSDFNLWFSPAASPITEYGIDHDLTSFNTQSSLDGNSLDTAPIFEGGGADEALGYPLASLALAEGSPGKDAASDGTDMGANIGLVGPGSPDVPPDDDGGDEGGSSSSGEPPSTTGTTGDGDSGSANSSSSGDPTDGTGSSGGPPLDGMSQPGGCGCTSGDAPNPGWLFLLMLLVPLRQGQKSSLGRSRSSQSSQQLSSSRVSSNTYQSPQCSSSSASDS